MPASPPRFKRSPFCLLHWEGEILLARNANTGRMFRGADRYLDLLLHLADWTTATEMAERTSVSDAAGIERALDRLAGMGLVVRHPPGAGDLLPDNGGQTSWDLVNLAVQRQSGRGGYDPSKTKEGHPPPAFKPVPELERIALPRVGLDDSWSLREALEARRTVRTYSDSALSLDELGRLLWSAARVTQVESHPKLGEVSRRPTPSGGARHALEIYPVCNDVAGLEQGAHYYHPKEHALYFLKPADETQERLNRDIGLATGGLLSRDPPAILLVTAVFQRTMWKYDLLGLSLILRDIGALYQTLYLVATAMGLAPCAIGGGAESDNARWLGLDPLVESQVGAFLLGPSASPRQRPGPATERRPH